jgi:hypothetical protein
MVATKKMHASSSVATAAKRWMASFALPPESSTIWRWWLQKNACQLFGGHRGQAVDGFVCPPSRVIHHLAMVATKKMYDNSWVATAAKRWMASFALPPKSSTIWRWWLQRVPIGQTANRPEPDNLPGDLHHLAMVATTR